jgi:putative hemolysin
MEPHVFRDLLKGLTPPPLERPLGKILRLETLDRMYGSLRGGSEADFTARVLGSLGVTPRVSAQDLARIPPRGPAIVVANHPFGVADGIVLVHLLSQVRPDVRILANRFLAGVEEARARFIAVDVFGGPEAVRYNQRGLREALDWLESGGALCIFPAGEVAHLDLRRGGIADAPWNPAAAALARRTGAAVVPAYFSGSNSALFQLAGLVHPKLRTALLPHEFINMRNRSVEVRFGHPVSGKHLAGCPDDARATDLLRRKTYWLGRRSGAREAALRRAGPVAGGIPKDWLEEEVAGLGERRRLAGSGDWAVYAFTREEAPLVVREIGRLREITFRRAGEGAGRALDLDRFDDEYTHLLLWNHRRGAICGAYRLRGTDLARGRLYTRTLFRFKRGFFDRLGPALELGRSFVVPEAQRGYQPLLQLWRGIAAYLNRHPRYGALFGAVSISGSYQPASRQLMVKWLRAHAWSERFAPLVRPRMPLLALPGQPLPEAADLEALDAWVRDLEPCGKGVPVLVRQYLKMGGEFAGFHLDRGFSSALDGLVIVRLDAANRALLDRLGAAPREPHAA